MAASRSGLGDPGRLRNFTEQIGRFARAQGGGPFQLAETFFNSAGSILPGPIHSRPLAQVLWHRSLWPVILWTPRTDESINSTSPWSGSSKILASVCPIRECVRAA